MTQEKSIPELLDGLQSIVDTLKSSLPKEAPIIISKSVDPSRALHLREACVHRIAELAESACDAFKKGSHVSGYLLVRASMETIALFWYFVDEVRDALKNGDIEDLRKVLTRMLMGVKLEAARDAIAKVTQKTRAELGKSLDPIHVMDLLRHVEKEVPSFMEHYDFLCEVSHPNAAGLIKAYVRNDWEKKVVYFGKEEGCFESHLPSDLKGFIACLECYMDLYDKSAGILTRFISLSESLL